MHPAQDHKDLPPQERVLQLEKEVENLRAKLERYDSVHDVAGMAVGYAVRTWLGKNINRAADELAQGTERWTRGDASLPFRELIDFAAVAIARFTRVGVFRLVSTCLIAIATLWFTITQAVLLSNQNRLMDSQKRVQAADLYIRLSDQRQEILRSLIIARESTSMIEELGKTGPLKDRDLILRYAAGQGTRLPVLQAVIEKCAITATYARTPTQILDELLRAAEKADADTAEKRRGELLRWWEDARIRCQREYDQSQTLFEQVQADMRPAN